MTGIYLKDFGSLDEIEDYFGVRLACPEEAILLAYYHLDENGGGSAFVLFQQDGDLFAVHGSHCSCYGLRGQWEPERTSVQALRHRLDFGCIEYDAFGGELATILDTIERPGPTQ